MKTKQRVTRKNSKYRSSKKRNNKGNGRKQIIKGGYNNIYQ